MFWHDCTLTLLADVSDVFAAFLTEMMFDFLPQMAKYIIQSPMYQRYEHVKNG